MAVVDIDRVHHTTRTAWECECGGIEQRSRLRGCGDVENHLFSIPGHKVDAIDSNGAGDMFAGAVLYSLSQGKSLEEGAKFGCYAASKIVSRIGPRLSKEDYKQIKENYS